jgi:predicted N-acetyltransferase YhbS
VKATLRAVRRRELPAIYDLLERCFPEAPRSLFVRQTEHDATFRLRNGRVAEIDGRVAGYVRIFARTMLVRGVPVRAGGIGSVATYPDARAGGIATALLRDALEEMRRDGMALSFLFTGIPAFYERLGYRIVLQPSVGVDAAEAAALPSPSLYAVRPLVEGDLARLLRIYVSAAAGSTGAVVRTRRSWRDTKSWLGEAPGDGFVAERNGVPVAYVRSRCRTYGHEIVEAEHLHNHDEAIMPLIAAVGALAASHGEGLVASVPEGHTLDTAMRTLPSSTRTTDVRYPMMMRLLSLDSLLSAMMPYLVSRVASHRGPSFRLGLGAPDGDSVVLDVAARSVASRRGGAEFELDEGGTLDALLGQQCASTLVRPKPAAEVARRIDAILPQAALHFWAADRI